MSEEGAVVEGETTNRRGILALGVAAVAGVAGGLLASGNRVQAHGTAHYESNTSDPAVHGNNSGTGPGVEGTSAAGGKPGVKGRGHVGVQGTSPSGWGVWGDGPVGVRGTTEDGIAVEGMAATSGGGVIGSTGSGVAVGGGSTTGTGVNGSSTSGTGVRAGSQTGLALDVVGKARFSSAGSSTVPARAYTAPVSDPGVTADSHITITFTADPGRARVAWVERHPGTGFTVHMLGRARWDVAFTYLIVEPGP